MWLSSELSHTGCFTSITCCCHRGSCLLGLTQQDIRSRNFTSPLPCAAELFLRVAVKVRMDFKTLLPSGDKRHQTRLFYISVILKTFSLFLLDVTTWEQRDLRHQRHAVASLRSLIFRRDYVVSIFYIWFFCLQTRGDVKQKKEEKKTR